MLVGTSARDRERDERARPRGAHCPGWGACLMSRRASSRATSAPKVSVSASVRLGLESIVEGNEHAIRAMLSLGSGKSVVDGLVDCMGVSSISAEMLLANYFSTGILSTYCRERINKSDKGGAATLAERIAREWAKPSFSPSPAPGGPKRKEPEEPAAAEGAEARRAAALADMAAKRAKTSAPAPVVEPAAAATMAEAPAAGSSRPSKESPEADAEEEEVPSHFASKVAEMEPMDVAAAVETLARAKITCEDVLSGLMEWKSASKAREFLGAWSESNPIFGCDDELMFEAVPRIRIKGAAAMAKAARIIAAVDNGDSDRSSMFAGDWDPDVIAGEDKAAFLDELSRAVEEAGGVSVEE